MEIIKCFKLVLILNFKQFATEMLTLIYSNFLSVTRGLSVLHNVHRASGAQKPAVQNISDLPLGG